MGLAASQAKLLSLTSRISDNELRSQSITAAKMALANQTTEASREYMKALNTNEFIYRTYDESGEKVYTALTGTQLSTYAPLKNQYALINPQGQVLVSENDAANFEASKNMTEFLEKYDVHKVQTGTNTVQNPEYDKMYSAWLDEYNEWKSGEPDGSLDDYWNTTIEYKDCEIEPYNQAFQELTSNACCYSDATTYPYDRECYMHILACLIDFDNVDGTKDNVHYGVGNEIDCKTSTGRSFKIYDYGRNGIGEYTHSDVYNNPGITGELLDKITELSNSIKNGYEVDDYNATIYAPEDTEDMLTPSSNEKTKILSSYYYDGEEKKLKTMHQYLVDLYFAVYDNFQGGNVLKTVYATDLVPKIQNLNNNLKFKYTAQIETREHNQQYYDEYNAWLAREPKFVPPDPIEEPIFEYDNKDKAQWYINLWHRMNGESEEKTITDKKQWNILEDGLMNSQDWLKYALESGTVSLERVNFSEPTEEGTGLRKATWTSIIYTNALDISEQTDETAIARAEAKYQQKTREIENKDKQYDSMLKLLDTEHNALQQEYDTTKEVIKKNTDRTLKIYQA